MHELKDPLSAIYGGLEIWDSLPPESQQELSGSLSRNSKLLRKALEDATEYVGLISDAAPATGSEQKVKLADVFQEGIKGAEIVLRAKAHEVRADLPPGHVWSLLNGRRFSLAVSCALTSLSRFCPRDQTLLAACRIEDGKIRLEVSTDDARVRVQKKSFRFHLLEELAANLGGQLEHRLDDAGTGVILLLPHQAVAAVESPSAEEEGAAAESVHRILLVDDNRDGADTMAMWLTAHGYEVSVVYEGTKALLEFESFRPTVVILDIGLPGRNGYEVATELRRRDFAGLMIAATGYGQENDKRQAVEAGFDEHLVKPVDLQRLKELIDSDPSVPRLQQVLVVEDNPIAANVMKSQVQSCGHVATVTGTAEDGLEHLSRARVDLVLCDLGLPGEMDGFDLAREVRSQGSNIRLVAVTGDALMAREKALAAGFHEVYDKPLDKSTLERLLKQTR